MPKRYSFHRQPASDECPAVPRGVTVWADSLAEATSILKDAITSDPDLKNDHTSFSSRKEVKPDAPVAKRKFSK